jgi:NADP-dependent 3-hydroxy acid dehydrogenase YdfG
VPFLSKVKYSHPRGCKQAAEKWRKAPIASGFHQCHSDMHRTHHHAYLIETFLVFHIQPCTFNLVIGNDIMAAAVRTGKSLFDLERKVALVTGASSGLGCVLKIIFASFFLEWVVTSFFSHRSCLSYLFRRAMATALASVGCDVILAARRVDKLEEAVEQISQLSENGKISHVQADLMTDEGVNKLADYCLSLDHSPDILINAAGINLRQPEADISPGSWDTTLHLNLKVPYFLARQLAPNMKKRNWGKIVNIASLQSERAMPNSIPYGASKGG